MSHMSDIDSGYARFQRNWEAKEESYIAESNSRAMRNLPPYQMGVLGWLSILGIPVLYVMYRGLGGVLQDMGEIFAEPARALSTPFLWMVGIFVGIGLLRVVLRALWRIALFRFAVFGTAACILVRFLFF